MAARLTVMAVFLFACVLLTVSDLTDGQRAAGAGSIGIVMGYLMGRGENRRA